MTDKKYFSRSVSTYLIDGVLEKDFVDALSKEPSNAKKIKEQYEKAKENIKEFQKQDDFNDELAVSVRRGKRNIGRVYAKVANRVKKDTFSRWLGVLIIGFYMIGGVAFVGVGAKSVNINKPKEKREIIEDKIDWAVFGSWVTILVMMAILYVMFRKEGEQKARESFEMQDIGPLWSELVKYVYGKSGTAEFSFSDIRFFKYFDYSIGDIDETLAEIKEYQTKNRRLVDLEHGYFGMFDEYDEFYNRAVAVCAIVIGSMLDKDIQKLLSLLEKGGSVNKVHAMLSEHINSDPGLRKFVKSTLMGNVDTTILTSEMHGIKHRLER